MDAVLAFDAQGQPVEPVWPEADVVIGNPPFVGGNRIRQALSSPYVDALFSLYRERVPAFADLVCYWFERTRALIADGKVQRAGLLATNSIRGGANRQVLEHTKKSGDIFMAWSDRPWILDGAAVRVSMVGFDSGLEQSCYLNGKPVVSVNPDLPGTLNLTTAHRLVENTGLAFMGDTKVGPFDIPTDVAMRMLTMALNPNGRPNSDVVRPWINGLDITRRPRRMYIIDFGVDMSEDDASLYEAPFEYIRQHVKPFRVTAKSGDRTGVAWWLHQRPRPDMRSAIAPLPRYIVTPRVAKYRLFAWRPPVTLADSATIAIARADDYFLGVLHSKVHELWSLRQGTWLGVGNDPRYTPTTTFETYPFPWPPGTEPPDSPQVEAIAAAARRLVELRDNWLNPEGADAAELKKRTLTNLYNARPAWLDTAHRKLDAAVLDAYGWPHDLSDEQLLTRLLALNAERAAMSGAVVQGAREERAADANEEE